MLSILLAQAVAFDCCAGAFSAQSHGGVYPPRVVGQAFDFNVYSSGMNFTQRAAQVGVTAGSVMLNGLGHWAWTNNTNCLKFPNDQTFPNYCYGPGSSFPHRLPDVQIAGTAVHRWKRTIEGQQVVYAAQADGETCTPVFEQGFGIAGVGGTADDSAAYFNVKKATSFPDGVFTVPAFCPP
ncbi:hypothetical protein DIPPA_00935 [Diplonema papillatum]|nr:hypothetical protein DIPPA_00935 [Diplonema papillatum]